MEYYVYDDVRGRDHHHHSVFRRNFIGMGRMSENGGGGLGLGRGLKKRSL